MLSSKPSPRNVTILGAGLSGLAAAQRLLENGWAHEIFEKNNYVGGHAYTHDLNGFLFDEGPHISFTKREPVRQLFADAVENQYIEHESVVYNLSRGNWIRHPVQFNLYGLPTDLVEKCLVDFVEAHYSIENASPVTTYADWLYRQLGKSMSEEFPFRYTRKYWTVEPHMMSTDWVGPRIHPPSLEEIIRGALSPNPVNYYYVNKFRYPLYGGFGSFVKSVSAGIDVRLGAEIVLIDNQQKWIEFSDGRRASYDLLISTIPLPELIKVIKNVPPAVLEASANLCYTSLVLINIGVERDEEFPNMHWMYFYDEDILFSRGNFPHRLSPNNAPANCGSIQVEVYHSTFRPLPVQDVLNRSIEQLLNIGLLHKSDRFLVTQEKHIKYANILFDLERTRNLSIVLDYLKESGIFTCGRYGEWGYYWTDDSIVSGWRAADQIIAKT